MACPGHLATDCLCVCVFDKAWMSVLISPFDVCVEVVDYLDIQRSQIIDAKKIQKYRGTDKNLEGMEGTQKPRRKKRPDEHPQKALTG